MAIPTNFKVTDKVTMVEGPEQRILGRWIFLQRTRYRGDEHF